MKYFQVAIDPKVDDEEILNSFVKEVEDSKIVVDRKERFREDYPLLGYNIYIKEVDEMLYLQWQRILFNIIDSHPKLTIRYRL